MLHCLVESITDLSLTHPDSPSIKWSFYDEVKNPDPIRSNVNCVLQWNSLNCAKSKIGLIYNLYIELYSYMGSSDVRLMVEDLHSRGGCEQCGGERGWRGGQQACHDELSDCF